MKALTLILAIGLTGLVGCASKPPLPEENLNSFAYTYRELDLCGNQGDMSIDEVVDGQRYLGYGLTKYTYDQATVNAALEWSHRRINSVLSSKCYSHKKGVLRLRQEEQANQRANASSSQPRTYPPINQQRSTFCNKIGSQVFCNTY